MMLRHVLTAVLVLSATPAMANDIFGRPDYAPSGPLRTVGYHDHARSDGTWSVEASSSSAQGPGFAFRMAFYRAAEVALAQGHSFVQILKSQGTLGIGLGNRGMEQVSLIVRFADAVDPPSDCREPPGPISACRTMGAVATMAKLAVQMGRVPPASPAYSEPSMSAAPSATRPQPGVVQTSTTVLFDIDELGQPKRCAVQETTAPAQLSNSACAVIMKAHYRPAMSSDGQPIPATRTMRFVWQIDGRPTPASSALALIMPASAASSPAMVPVAAATPPTPRLVPKPKPYPQDDTIQTPM